MALRAGSMRHRVTLRQPSVPTDGEADATFADYTTVSAEMRATSGSERLRGKQVDATVTTIGRIRWSADLAGKLNGHWQATHDGRTLAVVAAYDPFGTREIIEIQFREAN